MLFSGKYYSPWDRAIALSLALVGACSSSHQADSDNPFYSLSTTSLTFNATLHGDTPPPQQITVTFKGEVGFRGVFADSGFIASLAFTGPLTAVITVTPPPPLSTTDSNGTLSARFCRDLTCTADPQGGLTTIPVAYLVKPLSVSPPFVNFSANEGSVAASQSITLDTCPGAAGWTSSVTYLSGTVGWLSVPPSGHTRPVTITLSPPAMPAGAHRANITLTASGASISVPVVFMAHPLGVNFVSPYVATTNVSGEVIIRGYGFSTIANPQVTFGAAAATAITVVSDTEIRASHPALSPGSYQVTVNNASQSLPTKAKLVVVDPPTYPLAAIGRSGIATKVLYDAERRALYVLKGDSDSSTNRIERFRFDGAGWASDSLPLPIGGLFGGITLSPDGTEIIVAAFGTISHVNPDTLTITSSVSAAPALGPDPLGDLGMANDGGVVGAMLVGQNAKYYRYDVLLRDLVPLSAPADIGSRNIYPSGDGSRLILSKRAPEPTSDNVYYYDPGKSLLVATPIIARFAFNVGVSRTASRMIFQKDYIAIGSTADRVFDDQFNLLGTLPSIGQFAANNSIIVSPDGTRAHSYVSSTGTIRVFDLTRPDGAGSFVELAGISVPDAPVAPRMAISPDGGNLFLVSDSQVLVIPVP